MSTSTIASDTRSPADLHHAEAYFDGPDGLRLYRQSWLPAGEARAAVALVHGYADHSGRYAHVARALVAAGIAVHALDYRGHGRSAGRRGYVRVFEHYLGDVTAFLQEIRPEVGDRPLFLVGHSLGGLIALGYALDHRADLSGVVATSPFLDLGLRLSPLKQLAAQFLGRLWPTCSLPGELRGSDLTHDPAFARAYDEDPLVFKTTTPGWFRETTRFQQRTRRRASQLSIPCLICQSGADRVVSPAATRRFADEVGADDATYREYEGFFHEMLNEIERERPLRAITDWIVTRS